MLAETLAARRHARRAARAGISAARRGCSPAATAASEAARVGAAAARELERRAVIGRGAHDRQAERHVDGALEAGVLDRPAVPGRGTWRAPRRNRASTCGTNTVSAGSGPLGTDARGAHARSIAGRDDAQLLIAEVSAFAGVRVQAADRDARLREYGKRAASSRREDRGDLRQRARTVMAALTACSGRCVVASATRSSPVVSIITGRALRVRCGEVLGVSGEGDAGIVDDALVHGRGDDARRTRRRAQPSTARSRSAST